MYEDNHKLGCDDTSEEPATSSVRVDRLFTFPEDGGMVSYPRTCQCQSYHWQP